MGEQPSALLLEFNKIKSDLLGAVGGDNKVKTSILTHCDLLKDLLVQSELDCAILKGQLIAFRHCVPERSILETLLPAQSRQPGATEDSLGAGCTVLSEDTPADPLSADSNSNKTSKGTRAVTVSAKAKGKRPGRIVQLHREPQHQEPPSFPPRPRTYAEATTLMAAGSSGQSGSGSRIGIGALGSRSTGDRTNPSGEDDSKEDHSGDRMEGSRGPGVDKSRSSSRAAARRRSASRKSRAAPQLQQPETAAPPKGTVIIQARGQPRSGADIKNFLADKIQLRTLGIQVLGTVVSRAQVVVKLPSPDQARLLITEVHRIAEDSLQAREPAGRQGSFAIFSVPVTVTQEEVLASIQEITGAFPSLFRVRSTIKCVKRPDTQHWVFDTSAQLKNSAVQAHKAGFGFSTCTIWPYYTLQRCHHCQRFGHSQYSCNLPAVCVECGAPEAHTACKRASRCINCERANFYIGTARDTAHPASAPGCASYKAAIAELREGKKGRTYSTTEDSAIFSIASIPSCRTPPVTADSGNNSILASASPSKEGVLAQQTTPCKAGEDTQQDTREHSVSAIAPFLKKVHSRIQSPPDSPERCPSPQPRAAPRYNTRRRSQEKVPVGLLDKAQQPVQPSIIPETQ